MVWAAIVVAALVGSAFYGIVALLERRVTFWHPLLSATGRKKARRKQRMASGEWRIDGILIAIRLSPFAFYSSPFGTQGEA